MLAREKEIESEELQECLDYYYYSKLREQRRRTRAPHQIPGRLDGWMEIARYEERARRQPAFRAMVLGCKSRMFVTLPTDSPVAPTSLLVRVRDTLMRF